MYAEPPHTVAGLPTPGRCLVMGVVNVTPDSFSDGGMWFEPRPAIERGLQLLDEGADLVDVGGESTRPGAPRTPVEEELRRVLPVVQALTDAGGLVSVDTMRAEVARACLDAGAEVVNDVSGGQADPALLPLVAEAGVPCVLMHWRAHAGEMQQHVDYDDVVSDVAAELRSRLVAALDAGIRPDRIAVDPGLGFAKDGAHNWALLARLEALHQLGHPVLVGASRKSFLGALLADAPDEEPRPALRRDDASTAVTALAAAAGAWCVRVHDAAPSADAVRVAARWAQETAREVT